MITLPKPCGHFGEFDKCLNHETTKVTRFQRFLKWNVLKPPDLSTHVNAVNSDWFSRRQLTPNFGRISISENSTIFRTTFRGSNICRILRNGDSSKIRGELPTAGLVIINFGSKQMLLHFFQRFRMLYCVLVACHPGFLEQYRDSLEIPWRLHQNIIITLHKPFGHVG